MIVLERIFLLTLDFSCVVVYIWCMKISEFKKRYSKDSYTSELAQQILDDHIPREEQVADRKLTENEIDLFLDLWELDLVKAS